MKAKRIILFVLCLVLVLSATVFPSAVAFEGGEESYDYDYSREGSYFNTSVSSSELFSLLGINISDAEQAYLDTYGNLNVRYERVTNQQIKVERVNDETLITAKTYTYVGANGKTVVWTPKQATVAGETLNFDGGNTVNFGVLSDDNDSTVTVEYEMSAIEISAQDVNSVLNLAYSDAVSLKEEIFLYNENADEIAEYIELLEEYEQYLSDKLVFDQKDREYRDYLSAVELYEQSLPVYDKYLQDLDEYNNTKAINYERVQKYEKELARYNKYQEDLKLVEAQLKNLRDGLMKKVTSLDRQLYACLFSGLIDEVVGRKDELTKIGASKDEIDDCATASANLRTILAPEDGTRYVDLKTTSELYAFYINNYEGLRDNIIVLARTLYSIYTTPGVKATMHTASTLLGRDDYTEKLAIFIAQLIYFANALSDTPITCDGKTLNGNVTISYRRLSDGKDFDKVKLYDLIKYSDGSVFVQDTNNAKPISIVEAPKPTEPELLPELDPPEEVAKPVKPTEVAEPGDEPEAIDEPVRPFYMPEDLSRLDIVNNSVYLSLIADLDAGGLTASREELTESLLYVPTATVQKKINVSDMVEVTFVTDGGDLTVEVGRGDSVNYTEALPTKSADISATYVFDAWVTEDGEIFDLSSVTQSATLYPSFKPIYKEFSFVGDTTSKYLDVNVKGISGALDSVPMSHFIDVAKKNRSDIRITGDSVSLHVPYAQVLELEAIGARSISISVDSSTIGTYTFAVYAHTAERAGLARVSGLQLRIPCDDKKFATDALLTYVNDQGVVTNAVKSYKSGEILISSIYTETVYTLSLRYSLYVNSNIADKLTVPAEAAPGETVTLSANVPAGMSVQYYYMLLSDYSEHQVEGDSFVMPYGNIKIGAVFAEIEYTVKFESDGKILSEKIYKYGDTVWVPTNPTKLPDGVYSYRFIGWSPEISAVTCDVTYVAQFERTLLPPEVKKISWFNVIFYTVVTVFLLGFVFLILIILDKCKLISLKRIRASIKKKLTRDGGKADETENAENCEAEQKNDGNDVNNA